MSEFVSSPVLGERFQRVEHRSGLTILLCPMEGYSTAYAMFSAKVGSIDTTFKTQREEDFVEVPPGIAHFLEHKMFECEDGDAFAKYAKTGANANAFTSFDRTAYLFSCTGNFRESIEILLDFVSRPYFTPETVQKEQGIIGQEIRMYDDDPGWRSLFNLLQTLYRENPVRLDIAGTTESIAEITSDLLYRCYHTFYSLGNMVLTVAGNFRPEDVLEAADKILQAGEKVEIQWRKAEEPQEVAGHYVEQSLPVSTPLFQIGFKGEAGDSLENMKRQLADEVLMEILCGESSPLYRRLYDGGLINSSFGSEVLAGRDYLCCMFGGESRDPRNLPGDPPDGGGGHRPGGVPVVPQGRLRPVYRYFQPGGIGGQHDDAGSLFRDGQYVRDPGLGEGADPSRPGGPPPEGSGPGVRRPVGDKAGLKAGG